MNMAIRLLAMKRVLKETGSIYLHCDPTASHYLKLVMDHVFGVKNFRNEIVWKRTSAHSDSKRYGANIDIILYFTKGKTWFWETQYTPYDEDYIEKWYRHQDPDGRRWMSDNLSASGLQGGGYEYAWNGVVRTWRLPKESMLKLHEEGRVVYTKTGLARRKRYLDEQQGVPLQAFWGDINPIGTHSNERMGYPTQKPLTLLERIIKASCPPDGVVLDPFCGCGTTAHAAESLRRRWVGIDISTFAAELIRDRLSKEFPHIRNEIEVRGTPETINEARALAREDKFEFEKWVCGKIGAVGMYHNPGTPGADGGVDGLLKFNYMRPDGKLGFEYAIVQVKGGNVTPDSVRALRETVDRFGVIAGVMVCFDQYMTTVENQRSRDTFQDRFATYPVVQGYSVENLLENEPLNLPLYGSRRQGARLSLL